MIPNLFNALAYSIGMMWSDFEWFVKGKKVDLSSCYFKCSSANSKNDEKLIFPFPKLGKHLTFSLSTRCIDMHATNDDVGNEHRSILKLNQGIVSNMIKSGRIPIKHIPPTSKELRKKILVNPFSTKFLQCIDKMHDGNMLSTNLIRSLAENSICDKMLLDFAKTGELQGFMRSNRQRNCLHFVSSQRVRAITLKLINLDDIREKLVAEGISDTDDAVIWKKWRDFLNCCTWFKNTKHIFRLIVTFLGYFR